MKGDGAKGENIEKRMCQLLYCPYAQLKEPYLNTMGIPFLETATSTLESWYLNSGLLGWV